MTPWKILPLLALAAAAASAAPIDVGGRKQLFIDDRFVTESHGLAWSMNPPVKAGMVIHGDRPWDEGYLSAYGTVMEDGGKYRLWYVAGPVMQDNHVDEAISRLCYAESPDGLHWSKPDVGLYSWHGSKANNILLEGPLENSDVFIDPRAPAAERYKMVGRRHEHTQRWPHGEAPHGTGLYMYTSPDGLAWTVHDERVFPFDCDTLNLALYDDRSGKYLAYVRTWNPLRRVGVVATDDLMKPWPYDHSVPARKAGAVGPVTAPGAQIPDAFGTDRNDPANLDFYTSATVKYPWAQDAYLMFPSAYRHFPEPPKWKFSNDGTLDIDMAVSRDGLKFHRVSRAPYVGLGQKGEGDAATLYMFIGMLRRNDAIYQYYMGQDLSHGGHQGQSVIRNLGALFAVRQRLDGFVSVDADSRGGSFVTPPMVFHGKHLLLNLDASATGEVQVEIQDAAGKPLGFYDYDSDLGVPLGGYTFAECDPLYYNDTARVVTWRRGDGNLSRLEGKPVRLAFHLRNAKLFSFQFAD